MKVKNICILGGGTSGFIAASLLAKYNKESKSNLNIKCIYSSAIGSIGVGESTLLSMKDLIKYLGLDDKEWMPKCNATYKISIGFESWYKKDQRFYYPFGEIRDDILSLENTFFYLSEIFPESINSTTFSRFVAPHTALSEYNKICGKNSIFGDMYDSTAYHFDAFLFAKYLKNYAEKLGVKFVDDLYLDSSLDENGNIEYITCKDTQNHYADLFIDCSGFRSLLLGKKLNTKFKSYGNNLINNKAFRTKIPYTNKNKQLKNYTNCVTFKNGWCWEIPLWDSMSLGYVHTTRFENEDNILNEFKLNVKNKFNYNLKDDDIQIINFVSGRHEKAFVKNVVSIGLSYGFLEPLESTGIYSTLNNSFRLLEILSERDNVIHQVDREMFNYSTSKTTDQLSTFVQIHYAFSSRYDTNYWKYVVDECEYDWTQYDFKKSLEMSIENRNYMINKIAGLPYILVGLGYSPISKGYLKSEIKNKNNLESLNKLFKDWRQFDSEIIKEVKKYSSTYEYLNENIY